MMPAEELFKKAYRLLRLNKVIYLEGGLYNVTGNHGNYLVKVLEDERYTCSCKGFKKRSICSHILAVILRRTKQHE